VIWEGELSALDARLLDLSSRNECAHVMIRRLDEAPIVVGVILETLPVESPRALVI